MSITSLTKYIGVLRIITLTNGLVLQEIACLKFSIPFNIQKKVSMKPIIIVLISIVCLNKSSAQLNPSLVSKKIELPNGWKLSPAGKSLPLGDFTLEPCHFKITEMDGSHQ